jgi:hypothetical protein
MLPIASAVSEHETGEHLFTLEVSVGHCRAQPCCALTPSGSTRGRRIPYLRRATPLVSLLLAITPFAPKIASALGNSSMVKSLIGRTGASSGELMFGIFG